jgi:hypothetical protein
MVLTAPLCYNAFINKKENMKKDNSKPSDEFTHCRCCGEYIKGDSRSSSDKRYCNDCA